jgi:hypothetical protein
MNRIFCLLAGILLLSSPGYALEKKLMWSSIFQNEGFWDYQEHLSSMNGAGVSALFRSYPAGYTLNNNGVTGSQNDFWFARVSVPEDAKLVLSDGSVVGDEVCVGEGFRLEQGVNKGEFWNEGGNIDTPPIFWVEDVESFVAQRVLFALDRLNAGKTYYTTLPMKPFISYHLSPRGSYELVPVPEGLDKIIEYLRSYGRADLANELAGSKFELSQDATGYATIYLVKGGKKIASIKEAADWKGTSGFSAYQNGYPLVSLKVADGPELLLGQAIHDSYGGSNIFAFLPEGFIDSSTGIPVYDVSPFYFNNTWANSIDTWAPPGLKGSVVCSLKPLKSDAAGLPYVDGSFKALKEGMIDFSQKNRLDCTFYLYGGISLGDFLELRAPSLVVGADAQVIKISDPFFVGELGVSKKLNVVSPAHPKVEVSVAGTDNIKFGESNTLRLLVKNLGDVNVSVNYVNSRPVGKLVSCDFGVLSPGREGECLYTVTPVRGEGLSIQFSYIYKSCGKAQVGLESKTLISSKVLEPFLSEQVYSMGVHGGCENSYYACNNVIGRPSLFAGYKCYKSSNGFFNPASERFVLKFNLSSLPKGLDISGARLNLYSNSVGKSQKLGVYSVDSDWAGVSCVPGGDICTKPYCGECAPMHNLGGSLQSTTDVVSPGPVGLDVSSLVKEAYSRGDRYVSVQVRGAEGVWEKDGDSSCSLLDGWEKLDVSFDSVSGNGPYLEIVTK